MSGEYTIGLKYDGIHIPRSPITIQVDPDCKEAKKITIQALRDRGLEVYLLLIIINYYLLVNYFLIFLS